MFVVLKLSAFCFEVSSFLMVLYRFHIAFTAAGMWHLKNGSVLHYKYT